MITRLSFLFILALISLVGCRAEDATLQGDVDELCNGSDEDCRDGLVCLQGVCKLAGEQPVYSCEEICARLADCEAAPDGCIGDCRATIDEWSLRAKDEFATCAVDDITCEEARDSGNVPQLCYSRIVLPDDRKERCDSFGQTVVSCDASVDPTNVIGACYALGRTGTDDAWNTTDRCVDSQNTGICSGFATCVNDVLELEMPITLPDNNSPVPG